MNRGQTGWGGALLVLCLQGCSEPVAGELPQLPASAAVPQQGLALQEPAQQYAGLLQAELAASASATERGTVGRDPFRPLSGHAVASTGDAQALPLEQMRYQGWMQQDSRRVALVQAGSLLHLVRAGEALGAEQARVQSMDDTQLLLRLPDGAGVQRLALQQEQP